MAPEKSSWEEVYEELDFLSVNTPLKSKEPILMNYKDKKEAAINWIEFFLKKNKSG